MSIPISKTILATKSGRVVKDVTCEACGCQYYYELARTSGATAGSLFGLNDESAKARAQTEAQKNLGALLKDDTEVVPCPQCGLIQQRMVVNARRKKFWGVQIAGIMLLILGLGYVFAGLVLDSANAEQELRRKYFLLIATAGATIGAILIVARYVLVKQLGAKGDDAWLLDAMAGAPPALLADDEPDDDGNYHLHPAPRYEHAAHSADDARVIFCLLRFSLPPACCECLKPCTTKYRPIAMVRGWGKFESMPLCPTCSRAQSIRSWSGVAMTALMLTSASILIAMLLPDTNLGNRVEAAMFVSIFGTALAIAFIPAVLSEPYRMKTIDEERGLFSIHFRNRQYAHLVREMVAAQENSTPNSV